MPQPERNPATIGLPQEWSIPFERDDIFARRYERNEERWVRLQVISWASAGSIAVMSPIGMVAYEDGVMWVFWAWVGLQVYAVIAAGFCTWRCRYWTKRRTHRMVTLKRIRALEGELGFERSDYWTDTPVLDGILYKRRT